MAAAAVATVLGAAGCASSGRAFGNNAAVSPTASAATTTGAEPRYSATPSPGPTVLLPSTARLQSALLTTSDLGPAFTKTTSAGAGSDAVTGCKALADILNSPNLNQHASADFQAGNYGPFVSDTLSTEAPDALAADYQQAKAAIAACQSLTFHSGGHAVTMMLTPINFGGGSTAARMDGSIGPVQMNGYIVIDKVGATLLGYTYMQLSSGSSQMATALYSQAAAKAQRVLGGA